METERHDQPSAADGRLPLPRQTTPTWEVELLLSAGLVFALFQVPEPLHRWAALAGARLGDAGDMLSIMLLVYALMVVYALIATFLIHLTARAYWVALVGIDSVYPGGIRWEKFSGGMVSRREMQRQIPSFRALVERADNNASLCFAFGLCVVLSSLMGAAIALPLVGIAILLSETVLEGAGLDALMGGLFLLVMLPLLAIGLADKFLTRREGVRLPRWLEATITGYQRLPINRWPAPLILMLSTNQRGKRAYIVFAAAFALMMVFLVLDTTMRRADLAHVGYDFVPSQESTGAWPQHYRALRQDPLTSWNEPTIEAMVPTGDWLQLLVPYDPERHELLFERACGDGGAAATLAADLDRDPGDAARLRAERHVLDCLAARLDLRVDGVAIAGQKLEFSRDPGTGLPALLAMVPVHGLALGRHELSLQRFPNARTLRDEEALQRHAAAGPLRIPFWR